MHRDLGLTKVERIGIRQWACVPLKEEFSAVVHHLNRKIYNKDIIEGDVLNGNADDVSFIINVKSNHLWKYSLRSGPMIRKQWSEIIPIEKEVFASRDDLETYKSTIPEVMYYFDIDGYQEDIPFAELKNVMSTIRRGTAEVLSRVAAYYQS